MSDASRETKTLQANNAALIYVDQENGRSEPVSETHPLPVALAPGATVDPDSAREVTQQEILAQVILAVSALQVLSGNTDGLETFAQQSRDLLTQLTGYNDGVEGLLGTLNANTDGIEGLLSALGLKDDNVLSKLTEILAKDEQVRVLLAAQASKTDTQPVSLASIPLAPGASTEATLAALKAVTDLMKARLDLLGTDAKLEQLRVLLAALPLPTNASTSVLQTAGNTTLASILTALGPLGTETTQVAIRNALTGILSVKRAATAPVSYASAIAAGSSQGSDQDLTGLSVSRIILGTPWTAADLTFETSADGVTWYPLYDAYGNVIQYKVAANRAINVPVGDLLNVNRVRPRSGVPGAYVNQTAAATVTLITGAF